MEKLKFLTPLFTAGIFFIGFLALLLAGFNSLLNAKIDPLKDNQVRMETEIKEIREDIREIKESLIRANKQTSLNQ